MHDCRQTQDSLIDLIFDETDSAARAGLLAEVERCAACAEQYRSYAATLDACDEAAAALLPTESYWPQYHAALTRRLHDAAGDTRAARAALPAPFRKRLFAASIRVPAPLAAAAALLLVATSVLALVLVARPAPDPVLLAAPPTHTPEAAPQIKFIEVPIVHEKIVPQIIYLPRRGGASKDARQFAPRENLAGAGRPHASPAPVSHTSAARTNLTGFKPAGDVNLRIIREGNAREQ